jgi:hypothetical protein
MKTVWVLESLKGENFFLHEVELVCLIASVSNWKKIYPECKTYLYCCNSVYEYLKELNILNLWDFVSTEELSTEDKVNRRAFWAASKLKCIRNIEAPFVMIDCDLYFKRKGFDLNQLSGFDILVNQIEEGANVYPSIRDKILKETVSEYHTRYGWKTTHSPNVSFLYIRDDDFRKEYAETAWEWMENLSGKFWDDPDLNGKYMIFCEQKLLKEISDLRNTKMAALSNNFFFNEEKTEINLPEEYESFSLSSPDYFHLHSKKRHVLENLNLFLDVRSDILKSIIDLDSFNTKDLFQIIEKNKKIIPDDNNNR